MPVNKEEAHRALELLEDYYNRLHRPQDEQLRSAIERVIQVFKSRLFQALIDIQEYYEETLLDDGKTLQQKTSETNQVATKWERPTTNNIILPAGSFVAPEEPLPSSTPSIMVGNDVYALPMKSGPKLPPPPADGYPSVPPHGAAPPPVAPKPKIAQKPSKPPIEVDVPPEPSIAELNAQDPDWEYEEVVLDRGSASLGISVAGGTDNPHNQPDDPSVVITRIVGGGFVANDGRLRVDDIIISVNGVSMVGVTHAASVDALKNAGKVVVIRVKRPKGVEEALLEIDLVKGSKGLGFSIAGGIGNQHIPGDNGIFITKITDGGAAQVDGRLMVGDRLIFVNEANLENVDHDAAVAALKATSKNVKLVVGRASYSQVDGPMPPPPPEATIAPEPVPSVETAAAAPPPPIKQKPKKTKSKPPAEAAKPEPRTIVLHRGPTGLGFNIVGGEDGEGIFVSLIQPGGQADIDGQLKIGDRLLSVNGTDLREATHEQAASVLKRAGDVVEIVAYYQPDEYALFDAKIRDLREQLLNTSNVPPAADTSRGKQMNVSGGADTSRGKHVADALNSSKTKSAASAAAAAATAGGEKKKKHKSKFYVRALFDFDPSNSPDIPGQGLLFYFGDILHVTSSSGDDWWQAKSVVPAGSDTCYIPSKLKAAELERARIQLVKAQRGEKKKKKKGKDRSVEGTEDEAEEKILTYELVTQQEVEYARPIIVLGALKDRINDDLITEFPEKYGSCVPHTTRPQRDHEVHGRDYYFVESREQMEKDIENQLFVEAGQFNGNLYGTSIQSVQDVAFQGRHCVLDVGAAAIKRLQNSGIQPIAIFLKPTSPDNLVQWLGNLSEDQARKQYDRALKMEDEFGEQFTAMVYGQSPEEVYEQVKSVIESHSGRVVWVATNQPL